MWTTAAASQSGGREGGQGGSRGGVVNISSDTATAGQGGAGEQRVGLWGGWVVVCIYVCVCVRDGVGGWGKVH